jgi:hypothetical protein
MFSAISKAALLFAVLPSSVAVAQEQGAEQGAFKGTLTVQFTLSQECNTGDSTCSQCVQAGGFFAEAQGIAETTLGPLFAKVLKCFNPNSTAQAPYGTYAGTLTLSVNPPVTPPSLLPPPKDVLTLTYSGKNDDAGDQTWPAWSEQRFGPDRWSPDRSFPSIAVAGRRAGRA